MPHRRRPLLPIAAVAAVVALAIAVVVVVLESHRTVKPTSDVASDVAATIPTHAAKLSAEVITPKGNGKAPLLVMPAPWGSAATAYHVVATQLVGAGYEVVAYAQRGFGGSTGKVDFGGTDTQRDASSVISWALEHTKADPHRIGMFGMSYGAGISLLAAARDPRIKAVAALSTWTNVAESFDDNSTPSTVALRTLLGSGHRGNFDSTVTKLQSTLVHKPASLGTLIRSLSPSRSPSAVIDKLNKNRPAILIANAFEDSIFPPAQLVPFYNALTTPKRLELAAGDHGSQERAALDGGQSDTVDDARSWFDHYLRGAHNGVESQDPIELRDVHTSVLHTFRAWPAATAADRTDLGRPGTAKDVAAKDSSWQASLRSGTDSGADSGVPQIFAAANYRTPAVGVTAINPDHAFVWIGPAIPSSITLNGTPSVHLGLGSSTGTATLFLYVYDAARTGTGNLIDVQPYTAAGLPRNGTTPVTIAMQPISWTVPSGDRLTLVIDTVDPRFTSHTPPGTTITVSSSKSDPANLTLPATR